MMHMLTRALVVGVWAVFVIAADAEAQAVSVDAPCDGATVLSGVVTDVVDAGALRVSVNGSSDVGQDPPQVSDGRFEITLAGPLTAGDAVVVSAGTLRSAAVEVAECDAEAQEPQEAKKKEELTNDDRENLIASAYLGTAFDNFASGELRTYLNQAAAGPTDTRPIFGFDFEFRMTGDRTKPTTPRNSQLWVYGETLHGVRSRDIGCPKENPPAICADLSNDGIFPGLENIPEKAAFIMKNATSFESYAGLRWEFLGIHQTADNNPGDTSANLYLKAQIGLMAITANAEDQPRIAASGAGSDAIDNHLVAIGLIATNGSMSGSYVAAGFGRTDLFLEHSRDRWKFDGLLAFAIPGTDWASGFVQITVDSDFGGGSDSIQSYVGIDFDVSKLWPSVKKPEAN